MKTAILLVAYGSSNPAARAELDYFEKLCRSRFPRFPLRWAFSSAILRKRLSNSRQKSDSVEKAIMRLHFENFKSIAIQPLQTICGKEHEAVIQSAVRAALSINVKCEIGSPLLSGPQAISEAANALLNELPPERLPDEDVIFMGHGAKHAGAKAYQELDIEISARDRRVHVASMSGPVFLENIMPRLVSPKVWLVPLLSVIGKHALHDMAGDCPDSWKNRIEQGGHSCVPVLKGMAQWNGICEIWLNNLGKMLSV